jgi:hypothetical protein
MSGVTRAELEARLEQVRRRTEALIQAIACEFARAELSAESREPVRRPRRRRAGLPSAPHLSIVR